MDGADLESGPRILTTRVRIAAEGARIKGRQCRSRIGIKSEEGLMLLLCPLIVGVGIGEGIGRRG